MKSARSGWNTNKFGIGLVLFFTALLAGCSGGGGGGEPTRNTGTLTSITVSPANSSVQVGMPTTLVATGNYSDGTSANISTQVTWSSSGAQATVNSSGVVTGVSVGTVSVTATMSGITSNTATVTVTAPTPTLTGITISPLAQTIAQGQTQSYIATATYSDGSTAVVTGQAAWYTSDALVATINAGGLATSAGIGTVTITASLNNFSATTTLTVAPPAVTGITLTPASLSVPQGQPAALVATASYTDGTTADVSFSATWTSDTPAVATVATGGNVSTVAQGTANITASLSGFSATASLTVTAPPVATVTGITLTPASTTVAAGLTTNLIATANYSDGTAVDVTASATWTADLPAIASVSMGTVWGNAAGAANITASFGGFSATAPVTVTAPTVTLLNLVSKTNASAAIGTFVYYDVEATYSDGTWGNVTSLCTWSSSNMAAATVDAWGMATALAVGTTTISCNYGGMTVTDNLTVTPVSTTGPGPLAGATFTYDGSVGTAWSLIVDPTVPNGGEVFQAAPVVDFQLTNATVTTTVPTAGTVNFYYQVSSETGWDFLHFYIDGVLQGSWSGAVPWTLVSFPITAGTHTLTWSYAKDSIWFTGADTAWISQVSFTGTAPTVTGLTVTPATATVQAGLFTNLIATASYSDGTVGDVTATTAWSVDFPSIASVDWMGTVTGWTAGTANVTASFGGFSQIVPVTVTAAPGPVTLTGLTVTPMSATVAIGLTTPLTATAYFSDGTFSDVTTLATWTIDNPAIATVDWMGTVTGLTAGGANVTASYGGLSNFAILSVTSAANGPMAGTTWSYSGTYFGAPMSTPWNLITDPTVPAGTPYQSPVISHLDITSASITVNVVNPGNVTFFYRVESEACCDRLYFYIDGVQQNDPLLLPYAWSGIVPWTQASFAISPGFHTLTWSYMKDGSVVNGLDAAWVSQVVVP